MGEHLLTPLIHGHAVPRCGLGKEGWIEALLTFDMQPRSFPPPPGCVGTTPIEWP